MKIQKIGDTFKTNTDKICLPKNICKFLLFSLDR